jgi:hypothetical protein
MWWPFGCRENACRARTSAASFCLAAASSRIALIIASALPSCSHRVTTATMRKAGICTLARRALAKSPAESRSGVMRKDTRSPGAMHLERLAAKYVRSGMSEAGSQSGTRSKSATWTTAPRRVDTSRRREIRKASDRESCRRPPTAAQRTAAARAKADVESSDHPSDAVLWSSAS